MKYDVAMHLREQSKRTDLPVDVIRTFSDAYAEIVRLEGELKYVQADNDRLYDEDGKIVPWEDEYADE